MESDVAKDLEEIGEDALQSEPPLKRRVIIASVLLVLGLLSAFWLSAIFSSPETYSHTIDSLDKKKDTVLMLTGVSTAASATLSAIPDDTCTPLAEKLADLSGDFLVILSAIYLEKYLLTTFGFVSFAFLFPMACVLLIAALFMSKRRDLIRPFKRLAMKLALLGIVLLVTVPASVFVTDKVESTYEFSINQTIESVQIVSEAAEDTVEEVQRDDATNPIEFLQQRIEDLQSAASGVANMLGDAVAWAGQVISNFIEAVAVMMVLSCIIPILVLVLLLWVVKLILGVDVDVPMGVLKPGGLRRMVRKG